MLINVGAQLQADAHRSKFTKILLPAALPTIFVGLRLGLIFALINVVGVEFLINFGGLGQLINDLAERYDLARYLCRDLLRHPRQRPVLRGPRADRTMAAADRLTRGSAA